MSILTDLNPTSIAVKALVVVAVVGGAYALGHHQGYKGEKLVYDNYVLKEKDAEQTQLIANQAALKAQQAAFDAQVKAIHSEYTENAQHLQASRDAALADSANYAGKLRDYLASSHASPQQPVVSGTQGGAAGTVNAGSTGLLDGVSSLNWYLTQRFSDADGLANKFNEAVQLIAEDRKVCNGSLPGVTPQ
jgi:hypothetical protein